MIARIIGCLVLCLLTQSCLKKIEQVENATDNIFDPDYTGTQWWVYEDVSLITNSNNDTKIRIEVVVPEENVPTLNPVGFSVWSQLNSYEGRIDSLSVNFSGDYSGTLLYQPDGNTDFCLQLGIYSYEPDSIINVFSECKTL